MNAAENICRVCGEHYPAKRSKCPKCGCPKGGSKPAYLRCKRCGEVFVSRRQKCPSCGQHISPRTAVGVLLPPCEAARRRRIFVRWLVACCVLAALLVTEALVVESVYANIAYRDALQLWDCGGSIEANRRVPDPTYEETIVPSVPDTLFRSAELSEPSAVDAESAMVADTLGFEE